jgi:hypothetical protein
MALGGDEYRRLEAIIRREISPLMFEEADHEIPLVAKYRLKNAGLEVQHVEVGFGSNGPIIRIFFEDGKIVEFGAKSWP